MILRNPSMHILRGSEVTQFREEDNIIPILFRAEDDERFNMDRMRTLNVYSSSNNTNVPLFQIADFEGRKSVFTYC